MAKYLNAIFMKVISPIMDRNSPKSYEDNLFEKNKPPLTFENVPKHVVFFGKTKGTSEIGHCKLKKNVSVNKMKNTMEARLQLLLKNKKYAPFIELVKNDGENLKSYSKTMNELSGQRGFYVEAKPIYDQVTLLLKLEKELIEECKKSIPKLINLLKKKFSNNPQFVNPLRDIEEGYQEILAGNFGWSNSNEKFTTNANAFMKIIKHDMSFRNVWKDVTDSFNTWGEKSKVLVKCNQNIRALFNDYRNLLAPPNENEDSRTSMENNLVEIKRVMDLQVQEYNKLDKHESVMFMGKPAYLYVEEYGSFQRYLSHLLAQMVKDLFEDSKFNSLFEFSMTPGIFSVTTTIVLIICSVLLCAIFAIILYRYVYLGNVNSQYTFSPKFIGV